ncbi:hypothetical protein [Salinicola endophyticus]|uniref:Uncharacterized protein n=1 Tax=Salinicola endophyticus TaxID=1949083 RepID=A0AB74U8B3_9GAMM
MTTNNVVALDARRCTLHLLPVLQIDPFDQVLAQNISLSVTASWREVPIVPERGWAICQPYPNPLYFVGGSDDCRLGHFVELPEGLTGGDVVFRWTVEAAGMAPGRIEITHQFDLTFDAGPGRTWSMDIGNWWQQSGYAGDTHSTPEIGRNRFSRLSQRGISPTRRAHVVEVLRGGWRLVTIHESLALPAVTLEDCWTVATYGGESAVKSLEALR